MKSPSAEDGAPSEEASSVEEASSPEEALRALYAELEAELDRRAPRCELSGRCCDFKTSGHVLFSTDLEVAHAVREAERPEVQARVGDLNAGDPELCPYHVSGRCELRAGRPLGCRVYFCDPTYADEMPELAERYHQKVIAIHERFGVPYRYGRFVPSIREADPSVRQSRNDQNG